MRSRLLVPLLVLVGAAFIVGGCGSTPSVPDAKSCLKEAKFTVDSATKKDPIVAEGVSGTTGMTDPKKFVLTVAATAKKDSGVKKFEKQTKDLADEVKKQSKTKNKFDIESGSSGKYVWVVAGAKGDNFDKALACVKP